MAEINEFEYIDDPECSDPGSDSGSESMDENVFELFSSKFTNTKLNAKLKVLREEITNKNVDLIHNTSYITKLETELKYFKKYFYITLSWSLFITYFHLVIYFNTKVI